MHSQVGYVNFTWMSGNKKYYYTFDILQSDDKNILEPPTVTVNSTGKIPRTPKGKKMPLLFFKESYTEILNPL